MSARRGLLDTSVLIAQESGRPLDTSAVPSETAVCVVTLAELHAGVLAATDTPTRARRLATTAEAARHWGALRVRLAEEGRTAKSNDLWIAAVAVANGLDVVTRDGDFDPIEEVGGPVVVRI